MHEIVGAAYDAVNIARISRRAAKNIEEELEINGRVNYDSYINLLTLSDTRRERYRFNPVSSFGELFLKVQDRCGFKYNGLSCCRLSETYFGRSLELTPYCKTPFADPPNGPLILITHKDRIVAAQKNFGEPNVYGIEDVPEIGIFAKTISAANIHIRPSRIATSDATVVIDSTHYDGFVPKRIAQTVFSQDARSSVTDSEAFLREGLSLSHEDIVTRIADIYQFGVKSISPDPSGEF